MDQALILCRFLHFGAAMLLWGGAAYGGVRRRYRAGWGVIALTGLLWFVLEAGIAGGSWADAVDPGTWAALATQTDFGAAWLIHLGMIALLGVAIWRGRAVGVAAALALASLALTGHAAMDNGWLGRLHEATAALHLVCAGYWMGALPAILTDLGQMPGPGAIGRLIRFSKRGHLAVAGVIVTGIANTALVLHRLPTSMASPYQRLLAAKIVLVAAMVGMALTNRYVFVPRLKRGGLAALRRGTWAEIVTGAVVLALVAAFATYDPR